MQRQGRRHRPFYRISAVEGRTRRDGRVIEQLGWYDPIAQGPKQLKLNEERVKYWISVGAQPSDTVRDMLAKRDLIDKTEWEADRKRDRERVEKARAAAAPPPAPEAAAAPAPPPAEAGAEPASGA